MLKQPIAVIAPQVSEHIESFEAFGSNCTYITGSTFVITFQGGLDIHTMSATNKVKLTNLYNSRQILVGVIQANGASKIKRASSINN